MNISDCLTNELPYKFESSGFPSESNRNSKILVANTQDEIEFLESIAKFLNKTKNLRYSINLIDRIIDSDDLIEVHGLLKTQVVFGFDENKPIGIIYNDIRSSGIMHSNDEAHWSVNGVNAINLTEDSIPKNPHPSIHGC